MRFIILLLILLFACSKKTTEPSNPKNPYSSLEFWNFLPKTKKIYLYLDSAYYKYSFYYSNWIIPNYDTLVRSFGDTSSLTLPYYDSIWSIANPIKIIYDTIKVFDNYLQRNLKVFDFFKEISVNLPYKYPYPLNQNLKPIESAYKAIYDSLLIGNFMFDCSLKVYIDTIYVDSSISKISQINDTTYSITNLIFSKVKYRYKFNKISNNQNLNCNESDTIIKQNYAYKFTIDSLKLISYKGILYQSTFDTAFAYIQHHTNADANLSFVRKIRMSFIK